VIFYLLESLAPAEHGQTLKRRLFNTAYYPFLLAGVLTMQVLLVPMYVSVLRACGGGVLPRFIRPPDGFLAQVVFALVFAFTWDLWQYWIHRWQHASRVLWQTHKFHHTDAALNATAQARHHFLNYILFALVYVPLVVLFGGLAPNVIAVFLMFRLWGFVNHANIRLHLGPLTALVSNPQWHRIHHSSSVGHRDKNFATFFPVIDIIFGTYYRPLKHEYPATGVPDAHGDFVEATVAPFLSFRKMISRRRQPAAMDSPRMMKRVSLPHPTVSK
jgi:sterol desaturase/sphingolipid hydroxylase (fatty acid hydroxylase superfamily)